MSSLIIIYDGQRKTVKIPSPNTLMQSILAEAALHFKLDPSLCQLKHKRSIVDNSQPFRFANLSNNSLIDLVVVESSGSAKRAGATCKIALSIEGTTGTLTNTYDATISLFDMLNTLVTDDKLAVNFLDLGCEVIYLRSNFSSEEILRSTSFASIGLSGQSARLQIRFLNKSSVSAVYNNTSTVTSNPAEQSIAITPVAIENSSNDSHVLVCSAMDVVENAEMVPNEKEVLSAEDIVNSMVVDEFIAPLSHHSGNNNNSSISNDSGSYVGVVSEVASKFIANMNQSNNSDSKNNSNSGDMSIDSSCISSQSDAKVDHKSDEHKQKVAKQPTAPAVATPAAPVVVDLSQSTELIGLMLTRNFDSVTIPAVTTIAKYIANILNNYPDNVTKFLNINCTNKLFQDKVYVCNGATDLLYFIGFRSNTGNSVLSIAEAELNITVLERVFRDLQSAMAELSVEEDKRPQLTTKRNDRDSSSGGAFKAPVVAFDPFKSSIVRTAQQPVRVESETEKQLAALQKRRLEIEGEISDVLRNTEVLFPTTTDPKASQEPSFSSEGNDSGNGGLPRSVLSKILAGSGDSEGPPLTTKAVRDLQKAQKERVYSSTLVRVRFPDRVVLQGHFHPRHTMRDVYDWVHSSLSASSAIATTDISYDYSIFELYVSPPRTVLSPEFAGPTLTDLKLVPAALILLSWNENHSIVQNMRVAGLISSASTAGQGGVVGRYLVDTLLAGADEKTSSGSNSCSGGVTYYPTGASLDTTKPNNNNSNSNSSGEKLSGGSSSGGGGNKLGGSSKDTGDKKSAGSKPKWFKI